MSSKKKLKRKHKEIELQEEKGKDEDLPKKPEQDSSENILSTVSIAVPGSILKNAQSREMRSYLAGQIARAACIFKVDEIVVFDDLQDETENESINPILLQLARILQYLECPQYLRKFFFPIQKDLKYCGLLNPLDAPHHLRLESTFMYREGVVTEKPAKANKGCYVNAGLLSDILVDKTIKPGLRVTIKLDSPEKDKSSGKIKGIAVSPSEPKKKTGVYWGYNVRIANSLSQVFSRSSYKGGYDLIIGTSDRGEDINDVEPKSLKYNHAMIVYGGLLGLESAISNDTAIEVKNPSLLFDYYLNVLPSQGSRTIRTEEALLISLALFESKLQPTYAVKPIDLQSYIPSSMDTGVKQQNQINAKISNDVNMFKEFD